MIDSVGRTTCSTTTAGVSVGRCGPIGNATASGIRPSTNPMATTATTAGEAAPARRHASALADAWHLGEMFALDIDDRHVVLAAGVLRGRDERRATFRESRRIA